MTKPAFLLLLAAGFLFFSCKNNPKTSLSQEELLTLGDHISSEAQNILMKNVAEAIQEGGTKYAVDFCNLQAIPLTLETAEKHEVSIQRLSDKNRNPQNGIESEMDQLAWKKIQEEAKPFVSKDAQGNNFYYKPINLAMPTCLKCHGSTTDIEQETREIIQLKYPNDQATGYVLNDLRGMWKIGFEN